MHEQVSFLRSDVEFGVKWSAISQFSRQGMQWITTIILVRLLLPSDFGLLGMAVIATGFITIFKDLGTSAAIIQRKSPSVGLLSSVFFVNVAFGLLTMFILFLLSPLIAHFYRESRVTSILRVLSLTFFISGFSILQKAILEKRLAFNKLAKVEISAVASGSVVGIGAAMLGAGVWSLIYQSLVLSAVTTVLLWITTGWRPKMTFHWSEIKSISSYSLNLIGFNIFNYFARNADYILISKFFGAQALGYYTLAYRIMLFPLQRVSAVIGRVMFPVYSQIQNDNVRFRRIYLKVAGAIALISLPMMLGIMALSKPLVLSFFGLKWAPVIVLLIILAPVGMIQSIGTLNGTIYRAKGRTDLQLRVGIIFGIFTILSFIIGLRWGIIGVATAYAIVCFIICYPSLAIPYQLIGLKVIDLGAVIWRTFLCSVLMIVVLVGITLIVPFELNNIFYVIILTLIGSFVYLLFSLLINRIQLVALINVFTDITGVVHRRTRKAENDKEILDD